MPGPQFSGLLMLSVEGGCAAIDVTQAATVIVFGIGLHLGSGCQLERTAIDHGPFPVRAVQSRAADCGSLARQFGSAAALLGRQLPASSSCLS